MRTFVNPFDPYRGRKAPVSNNTEETSFLSEQDIQDVQVNQMSKLDLARLLRPMPGAIMSADLDLENYPEVKEKISLLRPGAIASTVERSVVVDNMSYMPKPTECLRSRVVALLRLLEDDIRVIENTRGLEMIDSSNPLNDLVMRDHKALYKTLKAIKSKGGQILREFHDAIDNLGYWGGYKKDERVIRIHHPNLPYGYIEV